MGNIEEKRRVVGKGEETLNKKEEGEWGFGASFNMEEEEACWWLLLRMGGDLEGCPFGGLDPGPAKREQAHTCDN